jgi:hypothetical protein
MTGEDPDRLSDLYFRVQLRSSARWPLPAKKQDGSSGTDRAGSINVSNQIEVCESNQALMLRTNATSA